MWGGGGRALQFHTFSLVFLSRNKFCSGLTDWLNLFQVLSEGDSFSFTGSEMHLALTQIFLKSWVFSFFLFVSWNSWQMHRIRENFKHNKLYLARAMVCSRSCLLVGCYENVLSLEKKYCSDLHLLPLLLQQISFMLIQRAALCFGGWWLPQLLAGAAWPYGVPTAGLTISALSAWELLFTSCHLVHSHQRHSIPC